MNGASSWASGVLLLFAAASLGATCHESGGEAPATADVVDLPGVDTHDLTPRERHEWSHYVRELSSPCPTVATPIAQCVLEQRPCPSCLTAAKAIAKAVREGLTREQVEQVYKSRFDATSALDIPLDGSPSRGPDSGPVVLVEFADFECPFCQRMAPELDLAWESRKDKVRFVYKFLPLAMHPHGEIAARAAIAAQLQGKFWEMHHLLFANGQHLEQSDLEQYARTLGLDLERFRADMKGTAASARIDSDRKLSDTLGVKGTPTIYVDGHEFDTKGDLDEWIDTELASKKSSEGRAK